MRSNSLFYRVSVPNVRGRLLESVEDVNKSKYLHEHEICPALLGQRAGTLGRPETCREVQFFLHAMAMDSITRTIESRGNPDPSVHLQYL